MKTIADIQAAVTAAFLAVFGAQSDGEGIDTLYSPDDEDKATRLEQAIQSEVGLTDMPEIFHFVSGVNTRPASISSVTQALAELLAATDTGGSFPNA